MTLEVFQVSKSLEKFPKVCRTNFPKFRKFQLDLVLGSIFSRFD